MMTALILLKVTVTLALALAVTRLFRHSRAAVRHVVLSAAFAVVLLIPVVSQVSPAIRLTVPVSHDTLPRPIAGAIEGGDTMRAEDAAPAADPPLGSGALPSDGFLPGLVSARTIAGAVWVTGILLFALPMSIGLRQIRVLRRSGRAWPEGQRAVDQLAADARIRRPVTVLLHPEVAGPMTCGAWRPSILLPEDARHWPVTELRAAIVHELAHVARFDWVSQCFVRVLAAAYWFHPMVWSARRQLILEAERACDDVVLRSSEATEYADQLVLLAQRLSSGTQPLLAMANRADLAARVGAVLDGRQARGRAGLWSIGTAALIATLTAAVVSPLTIVASSRAQSPQATLRFDAVSIKPCPDDMPPPGQRAGARSGQGGFPQVSPGRFVIECGTTERLISNAYVLNGERLENNQARIGDVSWWKGGPDWLRTDKFTIEAVASGAPDRAVMLGPMLRALLEDRFQLRLHRETVETDLYALTVAKGGLKLKPIGPDGCEQFDPDDPRDPRERAAALVAGTAKPTCDSMHMTTIESGTRWIIGGTTLGGFASTLSAQMDRWVVDRTGVTDKFNIRLEFHRDRHTPGADKRFGMRTDFPESDGPNIFAAVEQQLGLKIESIKGRQGYLVIDHVQRPTPNGPEDVPARAKGAGR